MKKQTNKVFAGYSIDPRVRAAVEALAEEFEGGNRSRMAEKLILVGISFAFPSTSKKLAAAIRPKR